MLHHGRRYDRANDRGTPPAIVAAPQIRKGQTVVDLLDRLRESIRGRSNRVVLPEGHDPRVLWAAAELRSEQLAAPTLLGNREAIRAAARAAGVGLSGLTLIDPIDHPQAERYSEVYAARREIAPKIAARMVRRPLFCAGMMVALGDADTFVAGVANPTALVIQAGVLTVGLAEGVETASSFFLMILPTAGSQERTLVFADCAVNIAPTAAQLADIAIASGRSASRLLSDPPRVALLSFSTHGSAADESLDRIIKAVEIARHKTPALLLDGELQADAALIPEVAARKLQQPGEVAGRANVLIFPDLNAANIAYKLTQHLAAAQAIGPFLQGFAKPISDLSRGASTDDIVATSIVCLAQCQSETTQPEQA